MTHPKKDRPWLFRTYAGHSTAKASNALYRSNLAKGQTGLSVAFDLPTQTGYDSDHILSRGEVGKVGVPVCHLGDMRATRPTRHPIHHHRTRSAHADTTGETITQRRVGVLLNPRNDIEHGLALLRRHLKILISTARCVTAPHRNLQKLLLISQVRQFPLYAARC